MHHIFFRAFVELQFVFVVRGSTEPACSSSTLYIYDEQDMVGHTQSCVVDGGVTVVVENRFVLCAIKAQEKVMMVDLSLSSRSCCMSCLDYG
jgi:peroxiredoxin